MVGWLYEDAAPIFTEGYLATQGFEQFTKEFMDETVESLEPDHSEKPTFATDGSYNENEGSGRENFQDLRHQAAFKDIVDRYFMNN